MVMCGSGIEYDRGIAVASHRAGANTALYWEEKEEELSPDLLTQSLERINSPLTDEVRRFEDAEIYCKAALHLVDMASGGDHSQGCPAERRGRSSRQVPLVPRAVF